MGTHAVNHHHVQVDLHVLVTAMAVVVAVLLLLAVVVAAGQQLTNGGSSVQAPGAPGGPAPHPRPQSAPAPR